MYVIQGVSIFDKVASWPQLISRLLVAPACLHAASDWPRTFLHPRCLAYYIHTSSVIDSDISFSIIRYFNSSTYVRSYIANYQLCNITGTGNQTITEEFTAEETITKNYYPLPNNVIEVEVFVRKDFLSRKPNLIAGEGEERRIKIIPVEPPVE